MLHAELHGKLSADAVDVERREDILTSTVFGVLIHTDAWQTLIDWMGRARPIGHATPLILSPETVRQYWFWPRLDNAEPDVVLRLGDQLVTVEAKFHSGKSGKDTGSAPMPDEPIKVKDQLVREWRACSPQAATWFYPSDLQEAIATCSPALVYLVKRNRLGRERRTVLESLEQVPSARMYLLTWEDLDEILATVVDRRRWVTEMRAYFLRKRLTAFRGFAGALLDGSPRFLWKYTARPELRFGRAFASASLPTLNALEKWRAATASVSGSAWQRVFRSSELGHLQRLAHHRTHFSKESA